MELALSIIGPVLVAFLALGVTALYLWGVNDDRGE